MFQQARGLCGIVQVLYCLAEESQGRKEFGGALGGFRPFFYLIFKKIFPRWIPSEQAQSCRDLA